MLERIEPHVQSDEALDEEADLVVRGWPLTVEGLLANRPGDAAVQLARRSAVRRLREG